MLLPNIFICSYGAILISLLSFVDQLTSFSALFSFKKHTRNVRTWERRQLVQILNRLVGESFSKNITFEQIPEEGEGVSQQLSGSNAFWAKRIAMQRLWNGKCLLWSKNRSLYGWSRMSKGERSRRRVREEGPDGRKLCGPIWQPLASYGYSEFEMWLGRGFKNFLTLIKIKI